MTKSIMENNGRYMMLTLFPSTLSILRRNLGNSLGQCFTNFNMQTNHLEMLLNADSKSVGLGWDPRFCISNKLPQDAAAGGPWITL